jgi:lipopolysaccharide/colanic/teichoic acid biosynthesis glycosyltransferase
MLNRLYRAGRQRIVDLSVTIRLLVLASPVLAATGLLARLRPGASALFRRRRPELFKVRMGKMSLVGPRPLRVKYPERYAP